MKTRKPIPFKAPLVIYKNGEKVPRISETTKNFLSYLSDFFRASYVTIILILIGTFVGVYFPRVIALKEINIETIFDSIFKNRVPPQSIIVGSLISAISYSVFFFRTNTLSNSGDQANPLTRFLAVLFLITCYDLYSFKISSIMLFKFDFDLNRYEYHLLAQGATVAIMVILLSLHKRLAQITPPSFTRQLIPNNWLNYYDWIRFGFSVLVTILLTVFISNQRLPVRDKITVDNIPEIMGWRLTFLELGALTTGLMVASFSFKPSSYRTTHKSFGSVRLLIFVICAVSIGLIYRQLDNTATYVAVITMSFVLTLFGTSFQRSVS